MVYENANNDFLSNLTRAKPHLPCGGGYRAFALENEISFIRQTARWCKGPLTTSAGEVGLCFNFR